MKYYRDETGEVFAYLADGSEDEFIAAALSPMTDAEVDLHLNPPERPRTADQVEAEERAWRDAAVNSVLWLRERHRDEQDLGRTTTLSAAEFSELLNYLQELRDWPQSEQFPVIEHRPSAPTWLADQVQ
ncbi:hypothetical protein G7011_00185 [Pseudomonas plecoglossicida]|nr:hypothetical protein [Pseudomonas plecoglossicida]